MKKWKQVVTSIALMLCIITAGVSSCYAQERGLDLSSLLGALGAQVGGSQSAGSQESLSDAGNLGALGSLLELLGMATERKLKDCKVSSIPDQTYTGKAIRPVPAITYNGTKLVRGTDFTLTYTNNTKVGTAKCTIKGKGNYTGTKTVSFKITKKGSSSSSSTATSKKFTVKLTQTSFTYTGTARKPSVKVTAGGKAVTKKYYTVTYKNNKNVGNATVTVKGKDDYKGYSGETTFKIKLKKTSLSSVSSPAEGSIKASWKKDGQAEGYQLQFSTNKTFSSGVKKATVSGGTKQTHQQDNLTSGKKYYVRIRSYKKVGSTNWYSEWSAAKQVSVK